MHLFAFSGTLSKLDLGILTLVALDDPLKLLPISSRLQARLKSEETVVENEELTCDQQRNEVMRKLIEQVKKAKTGN